ncbi:hypothetical protein AWB70_04156 [Caballeronia cordobensis]|uniref:SMODS and SLOG-associating 2TM effector domain-containing protein n=1 Tax=Caballeronia cordobensis TaxID=1353886 RepID=A0A158I3W2_CABCO|nr:DUF4231 domain-containing protein [Caballeronia cordobensis]SAL51117.1 hypothetical protein AWB70_04156 [Caballeronia cordobensis]
MNDEVIAKIWHRRIEWSRAADKLKARVVYGRLAVLILNVIGAIAATLSATMPSHMPQARAGCAVLSAIALAVGTYVKAHVISVDAIRAWTRARSVSEGLKTEIYLFCARARPYDGEDAVSLLNERTRAVEKSAGDLTPHLAAVTGSVRSAPAMMDENEYIEKRVKQQIDGYYRPKARLYAKRLAAFRRVELALGLIGTVLSAAAAFTSHHDLAHSATQSGLAAWVAVVTTVSAALAAHVAADRYDFVVMSYHATASRLDALIDEWQSPPKNKRRSWSSFVKSCEDAISVENESWIAKWMKKPGN